MEGRREGGKEGGMERRREGGRDEGRTGTVQTVHFNKNESPQVLLLLHSSKCTVQPSLRHLKITFYRLSVFMCT